MKARFPAKRRTVAKFFSHVRLAHEVVEQFKMHTPCWTWNLKPYACGYAYFNYLGTRLLAHVFAFRTMRSYHPRYKGRILHHRCHNPLCVNPEHLQMVTRAQHVRLHPQVHHRNSKGRFVREAHAPSSARGDYKRRKKDRQCAAKSGRRFL